MTADAKDSQEQLHGEGNPNASRRPFSNMAAGSQTFSYHSWTAKRVDDGIQSSEFTEPARWDSSMVVILVRRLHRLREAEVES